MKDIFGMESQTEEAAKFSPRWNIMKANSWTECSMERAKWSNKMEYMRANGRTGSKTVKALKLRQMVRSTLESSWTAKRTELEPGARTARNIQDNLSMDSRKVRAHLRGKVGRNTLAAGNMGESTGLARSILGMAHDMKANSNLVRDMERER